MAITTLIKTLVAGTALCTLVACNPSAPLGSETLGARLDEGGFGNPTMNNVMIQTGQRSYVEVLMERFANEVPSTITFAFNSAELDAEARATLRQQAAWIREFPEVRFSVYGHTDLVGSDGYNYRLGLRRARAVVNYLVSQGVPRNCLQALVSRGEREPVVATQDRERLNRRTITTVSGFIQTHPLVLNGEYARVVQRGYTAGGGGGAGGEGGGGE